MKVTRSYWLGLGSGLILSAMLTLIISPLQGQAVITQKQSSVPPINQTTASPLAKGEKVADPPLTDQPTVSPTQHSEETLSTTQNSVQAEQEFVIPSGASAARIADLLLTTGYINDTATFLEGVHELRAERQFQAGKYALSQGLTTEEVIKRLLK